MSPNIRVDGDVYRALQRGAEPFVDTPNSVLRRLLGLEPAGREDRQGGNRIGSSAPTRGRDRPSGSRSKSARSSSADEAPVSRSPGSPKSKDRASPNEILPEHEYVAPLLQVLAGRGGSAPAREVIAEVGRRLDSRLMPMDKEYLASGGIRWQNRVQFVRLRLVEEGLMEKKSPRGVWALTKAGMERARDEAA